MPSQKIVFDLDDFSIQNKEAFELLRRIKEHYPNMKVSMFTIPLPLAIRKRIIPEKEHEKFMKALPEYDWIEICPHGVSHIEQEGLYPKRKKQAKDYIFLSEKLFKRYGVPFQKIFKAPFWQANDLVYDELKRRDYTVAVDRNNVPKGEFKKYIYNWSIDDPHIPDVPIIKAHGHLDVTSSNSIFKAYKNFTQCIESDAEFIFISDYIKNEKT